MLNISKHYIDELKESERVYKKQLASAQADLDRIGQRLLYALQCYSTSKNCPELKKVDKQFKAMVVFPTIHGVYVQLGNVLPENAEKIKQFLEVEMEFKPEAMGSGSVIYYSPAGHQYFVRYI